MNANDGGNIGANLIRIDDTIPKYAYDQLQFQYIELKKSFDYVCDKYDIARCNSCNKYRTKLSRCPCGTVYCDKCNYIDPTVITVLFVHCDKCKQLTCRNCSIDVCSICNNNICRRSHCTAYMCDGALINNCNNIICCECQCRGCAQSFCNDCMIHHDPCRPKQCSCGRLVYKNIGDAEYPIIYCKVCEKSSCEVCKYEGSRHRASHSMISFLMVVYRGILPQLPTEIIVRIWEYLLKYG